MCHYITLVVRGSNQAAIASVAARHGRRATPSSNPSIAKALRADETQYSTTPGQCDCGSALTRTLPSEPDSDDTQTAKLAKKGWSAAKIERWMHDKEKTDQRVRATSEGDSIELWTTLIDEILALPSVQQAGLLVHFYSGRTDQERFKLSRRELPRRKIEAALREMREDELVMAMAR